ncbi:MAG: hypothetical protein K2P00_06050, partial [Alistipes sp.]|nr:hypothetical protein [Alistipes sp.]
MSRRIADLLIKIGADSYEFQQKTQQVKRDLGSLEKRLTSLGKSLSVKLTVPLAALGAVALKNADTQQQAEQRLLTALKGRTDIQQRLIAQAAELQSRSVLGDEVVIGQQAYLASLGMTEEQIGRVIRATADRWLQPVPPRRPTPASWRARATATSARRRSAPGLPSWQRASSRRQSVRENRPRRCSTDARGRV